MNVTPMTDYFKTTGLIYTHLTRARIIKYALGLGFFALISGISSVCSIFPQAPFYR